MAAMPPYPTPITQLNAASHGYPWATSQRETLASKIAYEAMYIANNPKRAAKALRPRPPSTLEAPM